MAFDINGFGGGFSGFDSGGVLAQDAGGLKKATALNAQISGKLASDSLEGYGKMQYAKTLAEAQKEQAKAAKGNGFMDFLKTGAQIASFFV